MLLTDAELTQDLQFQGTAVTGRGTEMRPSFYSGSSRGELIGHRCQSENSLPTDTVEMLPDTHNPQAQPAMFTRQVTKHLSRSLSRGCVGWEMRPHGAHGMGRSL